VTVGYHNGRDPALTTPEADGTINVSFRSDYSGDQLAAVVGHEGVHVLDNQDAQAGEFISHSTSEISAYIVGSYVAQALGLGSYPRDTGGTPQYQVWSKGWRAADVETYRARGAANLVRDFYPDADKSYLQMLPGAN
jgi:hypothetical protein